MMDVELCHKYSGGSRGQDGQAEEEVELLWLHKMKRVGQHLSLVIFRQTLPLLVVFDSNAMLIMH